MKNIRELLVIYRELIVSIIDCLHEERYDALEDLINKRQQIIDNMKILEYSNGELKEICSELEIVSLEKSLSDTINQRYNSAKSQLKQLAANRNINKNYAVKSYVDPIFLNKKI